MNEIRFVDTTLRDGQMSLWATAMTTSMMLPVVQHLDQAGFDAIELVAPTFFKKCVRELGDDPWERIRQLVERTPRTPLRAIHGRSTAAFQVSPACINSLWLQRLAANGVQQVRFSDQSNTASQWQQIVADADGLGLDLIVNLVFSVSPKHTDAYYAEKARAAARLGVAGICLKDPGGLLTPERTRTLVPAVLTHTGKTPVEFHTHCTTGLGPLSCLEAIRLGIRSINVGVPPLANGTANPSVFNVAKNARALGYVPVIDLEALQPVADHLQYIARRHGLPVGAPPEYDEAIYQHQVPGGMISNLHHQLAQAGMQDRLDEVLAEIPRVRAELGYPIMVTPYSQFVGVQAVVNVIVGERYKEVTDPIIEYALGLWGEDERDSIDPDIRDKILSRPRAKEMARRQVAQPTLAELRRQLGGSDLSDDELLLRYLAGAEDVAAMRANGPPPTAVDGRYPLVALIDELMRRPGYKQIYLQKGDLTLGLSKTRPDAGG